MGNHLFSCSEGPGNSTQLLLPSVQSTEGIVNTKGKNASMFKSKAIVNQGPRLILTQMDQLIKGRLEEPEVLLKPK